MARWELRPTAALGRRRAGAQGPAPRAQERVAPAARGLPGGRGKAPRAARGSSRQVGGARQDAVGRGRGLDRTAFGGSLIALLPGGDVAVGEHVFGGRGPPEEVPAGPAVIREAGGHRRLLPRAIRRGGQEARGAVGEGRGLELENSRITVMLSQIQPHFLYNSLTSVMDLCDSNPKQAKAAIADFADYLRGNLSSLKTENLITFGTELEHIEKYLKLEKLRFMDELEIVYDIHSKDFMLPALSVQPLVENAVKHGVGKKIGGGTVTIHTTETENEYIICVTDDGVGFTEGEYADDGGTHVGIENIKKRLDMMVNARLEIESEKGIGTKACILIPKRRD